MSRIRTIKPEFFKHEGLFDLEQETRLPIRVAYAGVWTCCDREGRFHWRPRQLKTDILPYDACDFARLLEVLRGRGYAVKYQIDGEFYGFIPSWKQHQWITGREPDSGIPAPTEESIIREPGLFDGKDVPAAALTKASAKPVPTQAKDFPLRKGREGNGKEGESKDVGGALPSSPPPFITLPLVGCKCSPEKRGADSCNQHHTITQPEVSRYQGLYPAVDVAQQFRQMLVWLDANPKRRKTRGGMLNFIGNWLGREQDRGGKHLPPINGHAERTESLAEMSTDELQYVVAHWRRNGKGEPTAVIAELERRQHEAQA
jgi:hypothetical protein